MKITFTEKKVHLPQKLHDYAEKKVGKLERYFKTDCEANLVFSVEKDRNKVELTIRSGGTILRVAESTSDMFASVDAAVTSMERQLRKHKTRLEKRLRQDAFERTVDEAILQMELLEHTFFAFKNEADGAFSVVYKRNDGGYGLIEDET